MTPKIYFFKNLIEKWFQETMTNQKYEVKSNKESGYGRYDVILILKDISKIGIVIEFKKIDDFLKITIEEGSKSALKQIEDMKYSQELESCGVKNIIKIAIVFKGKEIEITKEDN